MTYVGVPRRFRPKPPSVPDPPAERDPRQAKPPRRRRPLHERLSLIRLGHHIYARATGRFWMPCPTCGRWFGGHEPGATRVIPDAAPNTGRKVCPQCSAKGIGRTSIPRWAVPEKENQL